MKKYTLSFGRSIEHKHEHPERTARRTSFDGWDMVFQVWTNRKAMARSIRMQERSGPSRSNWTAIVPLTDTEGF